MRKKNKINLNRLYNIVSRIKKTKILVLGDLILDHYIFGKAERLSPEAPVPVVWANSENFLLGGASNVAHNIVSLGGKSYICGVVGADYYADKLLSLAKGIGIKDEFVIKDKDRPTTLKTRVIAQHHQIVRIDWESCQVLSKKSSRRIVDSIIKNINRFDAVIIEDYGKGLINAEVLSDIVDICARKRKIITVDPKEDNFGLYRGVTALTPNIKEAQNAANFKIKRPQDLFVVKDIIMNSLSPQALLVTRGEEGMSLFLKDGGEFHLPTFALEVFDVSGAGDTVIAVFSAALACAGNFLESAALANVAAGIVVGKLGVAAPTQWELKSRLKEVHDIYFSKL